jgi:hypothetical protein
MDFLIEIVFRGIIVRFFGIYTRCFFLNLFGKKTNLEQLKGKKNTNSEYSQDFFNAIIGLGIFCLVSYLIAYIVFS